MMHFFKNAPKTPVKKRMLQNLKLQQFFAIIMLQSRISTTLKTIERNLKNDCNIVIEKRVLRWNPVKQHLRSLLRSPHVNKNTQEHFHEQRISQRLVTSTLSIAQVQTLARYLSRQKNQIKDIGVILKIGKINEPFCSIF